MSVLFPVNYADSELATLVFMSHYKDAKELSQLTLGQATDYPDKYCSTLLQPVPRALNRQSLALVQDTLPFVGEDVWYGYELSWLNNKGKPQVAVAEFKFNCTSVNIVESKSFKLYLNSFNQSKFADWQMVRTTLEADLARVAQGDVQVTLFSVDNCPPLQLRSFAAHCIDDIDLDIEHYDYDASLLTGLIESPDIVDESLVSHLLKSNCLITNQPDWASLYISYRGPKLSHATLLRYLIAFRQHNEFHEQCVERIYSDLMRAGQCQQLTVYARYTRRGGLDINPFRSTHIKAAPAARTIRQ